MAVRVGGPSAALVPILLLGVMSLSVVVALAETDARTQRSPIVIEWDPTGVIRGVLIGESLDLRTCYARTRVLADYVERVAVDTSDGTVTVELANGDRLDNARLLDPLTLRSRFGDLTLSAENVRQASTSTPPVTAVVDLDNDLVLSGTPRPRRVAALPPAASGQVSKAAVDLVDVMSMVPATNGVGFDAVLWHEGDVRRVKLPDPLALDAIFGTMEVSSREIERVRLLRPFAPERPAAALGNLALSRHRARARGPYGAYRINDGRTHPRSPYGHGEVPCTFSVRLHRQMMVSHIRLLLMDRDRRAYRYTVETSEDGEKWDQVVDRSEGWWRSWQAHTFPPRVVRHVRVRGVGASRGNRFHLVEVEVYSHMPSHPVHPRWSSGGPDTEARPLRQ